MSELMISMVTFLKSLNEFSGAFSVSLCIVIIILAIIMPKKMTEFKQNLPVYFKRFKVIGLIAQIVTFFVKEQTSVNLPLKMPSNTKIHDEIGYLFLWVEVKQSYDTTLPIMDLSEPWTIDCPKQQRKILDQNVRFLKKVVSDDIALLSAVDNVFSKKTVSLIRKLTAAYQKYIISLIQVYRKYSLIICNTETQDFTDKEGKDLYASDNIELLEIVDKAASARAICEFDINQIANDPETETELKLKSLRSAIR